MPLFGLLAVGLLLLLLGLPALLLPGLLLGGQFVRHAPFAGAGVGAGAGAKEKLVLRRRRIGPCDTGKPVLPPPPPLVLGLLPLLPLLPLLLLLPLLPLLPMLLLLPLLPLLLLSLPPLAVNNASVVGELQTADAATAHSRRLLPTHKSCRAAVSGSCDSLGLGFPSWGSWLFGMTPAAATKLGLLGLPQRVLGWREQAAAREDTMCRRLRGP